MQTRQKLQEKNIRLENRENESVSYFKRLGSIIIYDGKSKLKS